MNIVRLNTTAPDNVIVRSNEGGGNNYFYTLDKETFLKIDNGDPLTIKEAASLYNMAIKNYAIVFERDVYWDDISAERYFVRYINGETRGSLITEENPFGVAWFVLSDAAVYYNPETGDYSLSSNFGLKFQISEDGTHFEIV